VSQRGVCPPPAADLDDQRAGSVQPANAVVPDKGLGGMCNQSWDAGRWGPCESADSDEGEGVAVRALRVPRRRRDGAGPDDDDDGEQGLDHRAAGLGGRVHPA
jgi:hypothetical protein